MNLHPLQQYPDVLCLVARRLDFRSWKSMRLVCKQFASWLKPYKRLMQKRMCKTLEIHCHFYPASEPFRGVYQAIKSGPDYPFRFVVHVGRGPMTPSHMYHLTLDLKDIWNGDYDNHHYFTPVMVASELAELAPMVEYARILSPILSHEITVRGDELGEAWKFYLGPRVMGDGTDCTLYVTVWFEGIKITNYMLVLDDPQRNMLGRKSVFVNCSIGQ